MSPVSGSSSGSDAFGQGSFHKDVLECDRYAAAAMPGQHDPQSTAALIQLETLKVIRDLKKPKKSRHHEQHSDSEDEEKGKGDGEGRGARARLRNSARCSGGLAKRSAKRLRRDYLEHRSRCS